MLKNKKSSEIYINGIAFSLPSCSTIPEFESTIPEFESTVKNYTLLNKDLFDNTFFRLTDSEASTLDPQLRLILEKTYEAVLDANMDKETTNIYVCMNQSEYALQFPEPNMLNNPNMFSRYIFDFLGVRGKFEVVSTECSSFLVAINKAHDDLMNNRCTNVIIAAANLYFSDRVMTNLRSVNVISSKSVMKPLDNDSDGFILSEGVCALVLSKTKNSSNYGTLVASSVNHSSETYPISAPSAKHITENIRNCLIASKVSEKEIGYYELHGTATKMGDSIEVSSILNNISKTTKNYFGCSKQIFGHSVYVSGFIELLYSILILKNQKVPKNNYNQLNNLITLPDNVIFSQKEEIINTNYACINSYGISGVNATIIIRKADSFKEQKTDFTYNKKSCWFTNKLDYIAPQTDNEKMIHKAILELTGKDISITENLTTNIDSILAMELTEKLGIRDFEQLYKYKTIKELAKNINTKVELTKTLSIEKVSSDKISIIAYDGIFPNSNNSDEFYKNYAELELTNGVAKIKSELETSIEYTNVQEKLLFGLVERTLSKVSISSNVGVYTCLSNYYFSSKNPCLTPNRISYHYKFTGPVLNIDTLCNSSFVAIEKAKDDLQNNRIEYAIIAGINYSDVSVDYPDISNNNRSNSFQHNNGQGVGEAVCCIILSKKEGIARIDSIESTNTSNGMFVGAVTRDSLESLFLKAKNNSVQYYQAHASGIIVSDAIEYNSAISVYPEAKISSIKPYIGHTFHISGLVSLIFVLEALKNKRMPPLIKHIDKPNKFLSKDKDNLLSEELELTGPVALTSLGWGYHSHMIVSKTL